MKIAVVAFALCLLALPAAAGQLAGVTLPDSVEVAGTTLVLNGMGLREKFTFDVYVGGLYLEKKSGNGEEIAASDALKRMDMTFVRSVGKDKIVEGWTEGFKKNTPAKNVEALQGKIGQFNAAMADMSKGDVISITYVPGKGTMVKVKGKESGPIAGVDFSRAVFSIWLGTNPPTAALREGLLGKISD